MGGDDCDGPPPLKRIKLSISATKSIPVEASPVCPTGLAPMARDLPSSNGETLGSKGQIRKLEFVRIITQALFSLGFQKTASLLEEESGVALQSPVIAQFRNEIFGGKFDESVSTLRKVAPLEPETLKSASFLILQQKFLELLDAGDTLAALKTLRTEISPLQINTQRVHELATWVICHSKEELKEKACWEGAGVDSRARLLRELQELLPSSVMIPERRLEHLVDQALTKQREACKFHNSFDNALCLYTDHRCGRDKIPSKTLQVLSEHEDEVWFLQFSHDGKYLASASKDLTAIVWEVVRDDCVRVKHTLRGHSKPVSFVAWSPDDTMLLTCGNEEMVKLWDVQTGECKHTFDKQNSMFSSCAWFPDGKRFVSGGNDKCIHIWDLEGKEIDVWKGSRMPRISDIAITRDGTHLVSICGDKDIRIYNMELKSERVIEEEKPITSLSVSKDGRYLLVNLVSQEIHLWDIGEDEKTSKPTRKYKGHRQGRYVIRSCFGGSDQAFILSGSEDSQVYLWHRGNSELLEILPGHAGTVNCVSWNPVNPHMFASASDDHTIRIWGLSKGPSRIKDTCSINGGVDHLVNGGTHELMEKLRPF
ncbi:hypothetical protein R1flu_017460 [Riccia fluitans]|uniref:CTLH domain-containing protein n=1 Tax=Riccia fluitans TaxID=41844 RepID=A0ABD1ZD83_9MARC